MTNIVYEFNMEFRNKPDGWIHVLIFKTKRTMRNALKKFHDGKYKKAIACCHGPTKVRRDKMVARLFFNLEQLSVDSVVHESTHAARNRQRLMRKKIDEERLATDIANIAETVIIAIIKSNLRKKLTATWPATQLKLA